MTNKFKVEYLHDLKVNINISNLLILKGKKKTRKEQIP